MKKTLIFLFLFQIFSGYCNKYENKSNSNNFPRKEQFSVTAKDGTVFELNSTISTVFEKLGAPFTDENLLNQFPEQHFYVAKYENISFFYDDTNIVERIIILGKKYKISDNNISVGSSYNDIIKSYGKPFQEAESYNVNKKTNEIKLSYLTGWTDMSYLIDNVLYYYEIIFYFDLNKKNCTQITINLHKKLL